MPNLLCNTNMPHALFVETIVMVLTRSAARWRVDEVRRTKVLRGA
jgi:hypothetical protein